MAAFSICIRPSLCPRRFNGRSPNGSFPRQRTLRARRPADQRPGRHLAHPLGQLPHRLHGPPERPTYPRPPDRRPQRFLPALQSVAPLHTGISRRKSKTGMDPSRRLCAPTLPRGVPPQNHTYLYVFSPTGHAAPGRNASTLQRGVPPQCLPYRLSLFTCFPQRSPP